MTTANRVYFECADIRAVRIECSKCYASISYPPDKWDPKDTLKCPNCHVTLILGPLGKSEEILAVQELASGIRRLRIAKNFEFRLQLEFEA